MGKKEWHWTCPGSNRRPFTDTLYVIVRSERDTTTPHALVLVTWLQQLRTIGLHALREGDLHSFFSSCEGSSKPELFAARVRTGIYPYPAAKTPLNTPVLAQKEKIAQRACPELGRSGDNGIMRGGRRARPSTTQLGGSGNPVGGMEGLGPTSETNRRSRDWEAPFRGRCQRRGEEASEMRPVRTRVGEGTEVWRSRWLLT